MFDDSQGNTPQSAIALSASRTRLIASAQAVPGLSLNKLTLATNALCKHWQSFSMGGDRFLRLLHLLVDIRNKFLNSPRVLHFVLVIWIVLRVAFPNPKV
ncbi:hypothetical protein WA1_16615 [Scytonema hofmannii PCC 7110]|uniref:Uncharacterized protein n=1 Tax=Scytonema hofmannii PCC 7110 TaxID=128403 RepID=A0A139XAF5_9CYAN|nr:hypothetical protein [Scytonema hofmannii]KYC41665.1 hypothetical protein WA1_16615 [Scytonema hofmannii PCC 7110]